MYSTRTLIVASLFAAAAVLVASLRERDRSSELGSGPDTLAGRPERCTVCHDAAHEGPGDAHAAAAVGCSSCHLGNPFSFRAERAHRGMERAPGSLTSVDRTCGRERCHPREVGLVEGSLMATARGIVAVDRWVFGEQPSPDGEETIREVLAADSPSPAQSHLRKLCAGCHLHADAGNRDDAITTAGEGCAACHLAPSATLGAHPAITARVEDDRCLGCHSRSGRIALSYQGLAEILPHQSDGCPPLALHDGRPACRVTGDIHHDRGLGCIDCHLHTELMGDGVDHRHEEEQVEITCEACHDPLGPDEPEWGDPGARADVITETMLRRRQLQPASDQPLRRGRRGTALWNLRVDATGTKLELLSKTNGGAHAIPPTPNDADHHLPGHGRLGCATCHATWAPTCTTCHTHFDPNGKQWDFGRGSVTRGAWVDQSEGYDWRAPTLAVDASDRIVPAIPGMVMTLQRGDERATRHRLYAAIDPHTTRTEARTCDSCHRSPIALGLGAGSLELDGDRPRFVPEKNDPTSPGWSLDGWTGLDAPAAPGTRVGLRSLDAAERERVLAVGRCTPCHGRADDAIYRDFAAARRNRARPGSRCTMTR